MAARETRPIPTIFSKVTAPYDETSHMLKIRMWNPAILPHPQKLCKGFIGLVKFAKEAWNSQAMTCAGDLTECCQVGLREVAAYRIEEFDRQAFQIIDIKHFSRSRDE